MSTTMSTPLFDDFLVKWEGAPADLSSNLMLLDASETVLKTKFPKQKISTQMIIEFAKVVALQVYKQPI